VLQIPGVPDNKRDSSNFVAAEEGKRLADEAVPLLEQAVGVTWYESAGSEIDRAALALCRLRRAKAGERGGALYGDEAVRTALTEASEPALVWLASRAISYMDESGFPETVERWFPEDAAGV
jgi:hypothetical protein